MYVVVDVIYGCQQRLDNVWLCFKKNGQSGISL